MKRRIFLATLLACAAVVAVRAQDVPADRVTVEEFTRLRAEGKVFVLDVRYGIETKIKGAAHMPLDQLESRLSELPKDREIVTYCSWPQEHTSARAAQILRDKGYKARALLGGFAAWTSAGGETEPAGETRQNVPMQNPNAPAAARQEQHVIASPNPTVDDSKTPAREVTKPEVRSIRPAQSTTAAPMKSAAHAKRKSKKKSASKGKKQ
jgi:rhodanese-related sulfurtransferase